MIKFDRCAYHETDFILAADFTILAKSFVAVLGPSGAGKTTLLNLIAGFIAPVNGDVLIDNHSMNKIAVASRPVGLVFQDHNSFAHLTAWQNVALGVVPSLHLSQSQSAQVDVALDVVGIAHLANRKPGEMSGGERQRIALARVLVRQKPVLLLDEAFAALGPGLRREMLSLVKQLHDTRGLTTVMVTHQPEDAKAVADAIIFVNDGKAAAPVATKLFFSSHDKAIRKYLGQ